MSHEQDGQYHHTFICDGCENQETLKGYDFAEAWNRMKELGWTCGSIDDEWMHFCPGCDPR